MQIKIKKQASFKNKWLVINGDKHYQLKYQEHLKYIDIILKDLSVNKIQKYQLTGMITSIYNLSQGKYQIKTTLTKLQIKFNEQLFVIEKQAKQRVIMLENQVIAKFEKNKWYQSDITVTVVDEKLVDIIFDLVIIFHTQRLKDQETSAIIAASV